MPLNIITYMKRTRDIDIVTSSKKCKKERSPAELLERQNRVEARKQRNRESAARSRMRQLDQINDLQNKVNSLMEQSQFLMRELATQREENKILRSLCNPSDLVAISTAHTEAYPPVVNDSLWNTFNVESPIPTTETTTNYTSLSPELNSHTTTPTSSDESYMSTLEFDDIFLDNYEIYCNSTNNTEYPINKKPAVLKTTKINSINTLISKPKIMVPRDQIIITIMMLLVICIGKLKHNIKGCKINSQQRKWIYSAKVWMQYFLNNNIVMKKKLNHFLINLTSAKKIWMRQCLMTYSTDQIKCLTQRCIMILQQYFKNTKQLTKC